MRSYPFLFSYERICGCYFMKHSCVMPENRMNSLKSLAMNCGNPDEIFGWEKGSEY
jgi:hypothetical protein